jgi:hypothetical protein
VDVLVNNRVDRLPCIGAAGSTLMFLCIISTIQCFQAFTQFHVLIGNAGPDNATNVMVYALFTAFWKDNRYGFAHHPDTAGAAAGRCHQGHFLVWLNRLTWERGAAGGQ